MQNHDSNRDTLSKLKTGFGRQKQVVMAKVGLSEETVDQKFNAERERLEGQVVYNINDS
jgi:hypothetical protein